MSKIKLLTVAVIGLLVLNLCMVTFLFFRKPPPPRLRAEGPKKIIIHRLHFGAQQATQYEMLINKHQEIIHLLEDSIRSAKNNLYKTLTTTNHPGKDSLIGQLSHLQQQIELTNYSHFEAIRKLCKPDQIGDFNKLTEDLARFFDRRKNNLPPPKD